MSKIDKQQKDMLVCLLKLKIVEFTLHAHYDAVSVAGNDKLKGYAENGTYTVRWK